MSRDNTVIQCLYNIASLLRFMPIIRDGKTETEILIEEVKKLTNSSKQLESLTKVLIVLTVILAILTVIAIFK